jgi:hypothetical protein
MTLHRAIAWFQNPPGAASSLQFQASSFQNLPETANRVESRVSHRKQTVAHHPTRDTSQDRCRALMPFPSSSLQRPASSIRRLIGTRERLETHVSYRKQSVGYTSNRYTSRLAFNQPSDQFSSPAATAPRFSSHSALLTSHYRKALGTSILRRPMSANPQTPRKRGSAR